MGGNSKVVLLDDDGGADVQASGVQSILLSVAADEGEPWACGFNGDLVRRVDGRWCQITDLHHFDHLFAIDVDGGKVTVTGLGGWVHERGLDGAWTSKKLADAHWFGATTGGGVTCVAGAGGAVWAHGTLRAFGHATWQCVAPVGDDFVVAGTGGMMGRIGGVPQQIGERAWYGVAGEELIVLVGAEGWVAELKPR